MIRLALMAFLVAAPAVAQDNSNLKRLTLRTDLWVGKRLVGLKLGATTFAPVP